MSYIWYYGSEELPVPSYQITGVDTAPQSIVTDKTLPEQRNVKQRTDVLARAIIEAVNNPKPTDEEDYDNYIAWLHKLS